MPIHQGTDSYGSFYQFGNQKKYYYIPNNLISMNIARKKAAAQGRAIEWSKHKFK